MVWSFLFHDDVVPVEIYYLYCLVRTYSYFVIYCYCCVKGNIQFYLVLTFAIISILMTYFIYISFFHYFHFYFYFNFSNHKFNFYLKSRFLFISFFQFEY